MDAAFTPKHRLLEPPRQRLIVDYFFNKPAIAQSAEPLENLILKSIARHGLDLKFFVTTGLLHDDNFGQSRVTIYRLKSSEHHGYLDFYFDQKVTVNVLMIYIEPAYQGSFWNLRKFFVLKLCKVLFEAGATVVRGAAQSNDKPLRRHPSKRGDWRKRITSDGTTRLVKLYERLGLVRVNADSIIMILTKERFGQLSRVN